MIARRRAPARVSLECVADVGAVPATFRRETRMPTPTRRQAPAAKRATRSTASTASRAGARRGVAKTAKTARSRKSATTRGRATGARRRAAANDALAMLRDDHDRVDRMFKRYEKTKEDGRKDALREEILQEVRVHAQLEEEIFYPALRAAAGEDPKGKAGELLAEAHTEHDTVKWLMAQLEGGGLDDTEVDAHVKVMAEYIRHHVKEEEGEMFKAARRAGLDVEDLGARMQARKRELAAG